jgi:hypothetical protein
LMQINQYHISQKSFVQVETPLYLTSITYQSSYLLIRNLLLYFLHLRSIKPEMTWIFCHGCITPCMILNYLELKTGFLSIKHFCKTIKNCHVQLYKQQHHSNRCSEVLLRT